MSNWMTIPLGGRPSEESLKRYIGCRVRLKRDYTEITGKLLDLNLDFISFDALKPIMLASRDIVQYDQDGPAPKPSWDSEVKELAKVMYESRHTRLGGAPWGDLVTDSKEQWYHLAKAALDWGIDGNKDYDGWYDSSTKPKHDEPPSYGPRRSPSEGGHLIGYSPDCRCGHCSELRRFWKQTYGFAS